MSTAPTARAQRCFKAPAGLASTTVPEAREPARIEAACIEPGSVAFGRARLALVLAGFSTFSLLSEAWETGTATVSTACGRTRTVRALSRGWRVSGSIS